MSTGYGPSYGAPPNEVGDYRTLAMWMGLQSAYEFPFPIDANFFIVQYSDRPYVDTSSQLNRVSKWWLIGLGYTNDIEKARWCHGRFGWHTVGYRIQSSQLEGLLSELNQCVPYFGQNYFSELRGSDGLGMSSNCK
jgi:hypothetical protein